MTHDEEHTDPRQYEGQKEAEQGIPRELVRGLPANVVGFVFRSHDDGGTLPAKNLVRQGGEGIPGSGQMTVSYHSRRLQNPSYGGGYRMITSNEELGGRKAHKKKPCDGEPVWVQCEGFRCLAFLDKRGQWRAFYDRSELPRVLKVLNNPPDQ